MTVEIDDVEETSSNGIMYGDVDERANALMAKMNAAENAAKEEAAQAEEAEGAEEAGGESSEETKTSEKPTAASEKKAGETSGEKESRLAKLAAEERERRRTYAEKAREEQSYSSRVADIERRERELKERESMWDDPSRLLETLEKKVGGERLGEWIVQQADPAKKHTSEAIKAILPEIEGLKQFAQQYKQEQERAKYQKEVEASENSFKEIVEKHAEDAPRLARAMSKNARKAIDRAHAKAASLQAAGKEFNLFDVIEALESDFEEDGAYGPEAGATATEKATKANRSVAAKVHGKIVSRGSGGNSATPSKTGGKSALNDRIAAAERHLRNS